MKRFEVITDFNNGNVSTSNHEEWNEAAIKAMSSILLPYCIKVTIIERGNNTAVTTISGTHTVVL